MSAGTHTPGPWRINEFGEVIGGDGRKLLASGVSLTSGNHDDADMAAANARLIAAAPDMLASLREFVEAAERSGITLAHDALLNRYERAKAAISKAEGRS